MSLKVDFSKNIFFYSYHQTSKKPNSTCQVSSIYDLFSTTKNISKEHLGSFMASKHM